MAASLHMQEPTPLPLNEVTRASDPPRRGVALGPTPRHHHNAYTWRAARMQFQPIKRSKFGFDARWARRLMRAVDRWLGIPTQWQDPFVQFIYRVV